MEIAKAFVLDCIVNKYLEKIAKRGRLATTVALTGLGAVGGAGLGRAAADKKNKKRDTILGAVRGAIAVGGTRMAVLQGRKTSANFIRRVDRTMHNQGYRTAFAESKATGRYSKYPYQRFYRTGSGTTPNIFRDYKKDLADFGVKPESFKTKADASKHFKTQLHRNHPDKVGAQNTKKFQDLSTARDRLMKSEWFNKLAARLPHLDKEYVKRQAAYKAEDAFSRRAVQSAPNNKEFVQGLTIDSRVKKEMSQRKRSEMRMAENKGKGQFAHFMRREALIDRIVSGKLRRAIPRG